MTLSEAAVAVLSTPDPWEKAAVSRRMAADWFARQDADGAMEIGVASPPDFPARPLRPELVNPRDVPRRRAKGARGRATLLHAIAHIELNAIDLHWDIIARFSDTKMPRGFYDDWVLAADQESKHFMLLSDRLVAYDTSYGEFSAHAGMWQAASDTAGDLQARLAVVPMVLEARGLDVTPAMITMFENARDPDTVAALNTIYAEEVAHVAYGSKWFHFLCGRHELDPKETFHALVRKYFHSNLRPPFNEEKRAEAGLPPDFYWPLVE